MSLFGTLSELFAKEEEGQKPKARKIKPKIRNQKPKVKNQKAEDRQQKTDSRRPRAKQSQVNKQAVIREAKAQAREIIVEAKDEALAIKSKAEEQARKLNGELEHKEREITRKLDQVEIRQEQLQERQEELRKSQASVDKLKQSVEESKAKVLERLEEVSDMSRDEAKDLLLSGIEQKIGKQAAQLIRHKEEAAEEEADEKVREILIEAMRHGATDYVPEYTVSTVELPSEDIKGKIIGKAGRNIHAFEKVTGVDIDLDDSPTTVRLSSFDPVRREIARISLEKLIKDGRIQPSRIEDVVAETQKKIESIMFNEGKKLCHAVGVYNLPSGLIKLLGRFKYRFSYGQNMIAHTLEETKIGIKLAHEIGANVNIVRLGCLLHDIGKVSDEVEGSHVELGVKIAKQFGMPQPVIDCIAQHHEDEPFTGPEQVLVYIADAISGARPGARYENHEDYVKRLEALEEIAKSYPHVSQAYAIQAGREVRVLLDPETAKDEDVEVTAMKVRDQIKAELTYPGTVTVTVIREKRGKQVAA